MPQPRQQLIAADTTPYYHCVSRCVRRSFLCGKSGDGKSFEHRRQWIEDRILNLSDVFAIDVCTYAVMHNHYHVVLHIDAERSRNWSALEVAQRWHQLFAGNPISQKFTRGEALTDYETTALETVIEQWKERLSSISWFMRLINEPIARKANHEDSCTGRFWEGRFKSQALLDEKALAACMAYVDLNPVRAAMAKSPEASKHTGSRKRIKHAKQAHSPNHPTQQAKQLMPFTGNPRNDMPTGLPFRLTDYLQLLDWTGRIIRDDKHGHIPKALPPILERLNIDPKHWVYSCTQFESRFKQLVGGVYALKQACKTLGFSRTPGLSACQILG